MVDKGSGVHRLIVNDELQLYGDVGDLWMDGTGFSAKDVIDAITAAKPGPLKVRINSGGGIVTEGYAIYNRLKERGNVHVIVDGIAASAASLIAMAGDKRTMRGASIMMIHDPAGFTWGTAADHTKAIEVLNAMAETVAKIYGTASGMKANDARQLMLDETWMDPDKAVELGFATEVDDASQGDVTNTSEFDYYLYRRAPENVRAANRKLPDGIAAIAARMEIDEMTDAEKKAAADAAAKIIADATTEANSITAAAKDGNVAAIAEAQKQADKLVADATEAAKKITDASVAAENATLAIVTRAEAAGLSITAALEIVTKAKGDVNAAKDLIIDAVAGPAKDRQHKPAEVTMDAREKFIKGATLGLLHRAGMKGGERNEFSGLTLRELARHVVVMNGVSRVFNDPLEMVREAFRPTMAGPGLHSTSDFAEVLANVANKSLLKGYDEAEETFQIWTSVGTLVDFKPTKRVDLNTFPALTEVPEGAEYTYATVGNRGETITLATYGKKFAITRQAIINDDLNVFTRIPQKMGRAAKRTIGNLVYARLTPDANPLSDGVDLFNSATHANYTSAGGAPTAITFAALAAKMALQKDPDLNATGGLNIRPAFLLVPIELEATANILMKSQNDPAATTPNVVNPVQGLATVVSDARMSTKSAKEWYLAANPNQYDTVEVSYLNGQQAPVLEQREGWDVDGTEFKVRLDAGVSVLDYRGLAKNNGE